MAEVNLLYQCYYVYRCVVSVQFNTVTPRVMIDSLRHEGVNGKFILKLCAISSHVKLFVFPNGRNRSVVPFPVT